MSKARRRSPYPPPEERFLSRVGEPEGVHGCRIWTGQRWSGGYGIFYVDGRYMGAHRYAWERVHGPIPDGLVIDHYVCDTPGCVEVSHLDAVSRAANTNRSRSPTGRNAQKTECIRGHSFAEHGRIRPGGNRECILCRGILNARRRR